MKDTVVEGTIQQLLEGHHMNYIECTNVDYKSTRKESFYDLQLDVKGCRDVYASFDKYCEVERLEGDNKYHAEHHRLQIKIPHPSYPSTRVSIQVPNLSVHFSPERYCRIVELLNIFYSLMESSDQETNLSLQLGLVPWLPAELTTDARILVWRGIRNTLAVWKPCYLVLSGLYLYVLESEVSQSYQKCSSKQDVDAKVERPTKDTPMEGEQQQEVIEIN